MVIAVHVEVSSVGHNSWQKVEKALADSAGLALRSSGCFRNEARNLPVTSYWQSCLKLDGIVASTVYRILYCLETVSITGARDWLEKVPSIFPVNVNQNPERCLKREIVEHNFHFLYVVNDE